MKYKNTNLATVEKRAVDGCENKLNSPSEGDIRRTVETLDGIVTVNVKECGKIYCVIVNAKHADLTEQDDDGDTLLEVFADRDDAAEYIAKRIEEINAYRDYDVENWTLTRWERVDEHEGDVLDCELTYKIVEKEVK